jgi:uncharacterized membrane protein YhaH (DUF805 family)
MTWFLAAVRKYAVSRGRARRREYWMFVLVSLVLCFVLALLAAMAGVDSDQGATLVWLAYMAVLLLPGLAVSVRRLHDTGRSGWWVLVGIVPLLGALVLFVFHVQDGEPGENRYGRSPKYGGA